MKTKGLKYDKGKTPLDLLPTESLIEIAKVLEFGASKYSKNNWRKGFKYSRLVAAALRHLLVWNEGEDLDKETKLSHLGHLGACVLFLLWMEKNRPDLDDRYKK